ncbi:DNA-3-methyladenine glycosylase 1 [bioreactor metagenome]|uniref:DNA-3-methyladenine glycosylase 1 n=1 Tax=bioreactor metagenome TaxID=1076179 RepID=A0A645J9S6_9ZZZZ
MFDDATLFAMLQLEGMQAGLSWSTVLARRQTICAAFDGFDPVKIEQYDEKKVESLLQDPGIIRNRLKVLAVINNARAYRQLCREKGSLSAYLWAYVDGKPIVNAWQRMEEVPASTPLSDAISKDLKKRGFKFVGTTIIYAFMQAVGMVNDHLTSCAFYGH